MSSFLYRLGRFVAARPRRILGGWVFVLVAVAFGAGVFQQGTDDAVQIPGAESTVSLDQLRQVFPELAGSGVVIVVEGAEGQDVDTPATRTAVASAVDELTRLDHVVYTAGPFDPATLGQVSADGRLAVISAFLDVNALNVTPEIKASLGGVGTRLQTRLGPTTRVHLGGDALSTTIPGLTATEGLGLVAALVILLVMFGSFVAAGLPLLMAVLGAGVTLSAIYLATSFTQVMSSAPVLALMLGLAVGIDYALFVLARHRAQLAESDVTIVESIARATATAGSAVLVAGVTVVIALVGLFVADMPFLTTMGLAAAFGVAVAVAVALTALPAVVVLLGDRLRPRPARRSSGRASGTPVAAWWVRTVTARPLATTLIVVGVLALCAVPAKDLRLSLPDGGALDRGTPERITYELLAEHFGPGYNAPLLLMIDVLPSTDPVGVTTRIAEEIAAVPGVASVPVATPNRTGDTAIIQIVPTTAGDDPATGDLVDRLRALRPGIEDRYGLSTTVTGLTAVTIDLSRRLAAALVPFGLFVVGLSVLLLATVFRSVVVPLSAALGYLLSVGAAFGLTSLVWMHGWFAEPLGVQHLGSVMAFWPILFMGVLFGLAMDYQLFLVSRMREHYVQHGDATQAVAEGFTASAKVVTAAALIMFAVFTSFVPEGTADTKPIAFSLAVGLLLDAFVVRMTLVPAVLALLGDRVWWLPAWAERRLPVVDVEGAGLVRELRADLTETEGLPVFRAHGLTVRDDTGRTVVRDVTTTVVPGQLVVVSGPGATAFLLTLGGRVSALDGELTVGGQVLPNRRRVVRRTTALIPREATDPVAALSAAFEAGFPLVLWDGADDLPGERWSAVSELLRTTALGPGRRPAVVLGCPPRETAEAWLTELPTAQHLDPAAVTDRRTRPHPLLELPR